MAKARVLGAVLAGGAARRFGSDKALAPLDGRALIDHAVAALAPHCAAIAICGREIDGRLSLADRPTPGLGPLGGIAAALYHAEINGFSGVLTIGCDMPQLPSELAAALIGSSDEAAAVVGQPLAAYWPAGLAAALARHLDTTADRSIRAWIATVPARRIAWSSALPNVNTPADLAALG